ncbi:MAG: excinuclease ABC subunit UvrA, partial [Actinomycetota bacterium]|nr:excinuclease ABC subunit UvrA [Actinomycetota bacterium]
TSIAELEPRSFSFNNPHGACPRCTGLGSQLEVDPLMAIPDPTLTLADGAIVPWRQAGAWSGYFDLVLQAAAETYDVDLFEPWETLPEAKQQLVLEGTGEKIEVRYKNRRGRIRTFSTTFEGVRGNLERRHRESDSDAVREKIEQYMAIRPCPDCKGARLKPEVRAVTVGGLGIHEFSALSVRKARTWLDEVELTETQQHIARLVFREIEERLRFLEDVGIGYLSMSRSAATLSGGEAQRIRLATQIGSALVGVLYVLDEPSIGLHQRDNEKLIKTLERLRDLGNSVLVVEHDEQTMRRADYLVDLGPGAGEYGGRVVAAGTPEEVMATEASLTGQFLSGKRGIEAPTKRRKPTGQLVVKGATEHNLK